MDDLFDLSLHTPEPDQADLDLFLTLHSEEVEHRPVLIEPFIRQGDLVMLTGAPGQGKSTLIADLMLACTLPEELPGAAELLAGGMKVNREVLGVGPRIVVLDAENEPAEWSEFVESSAMARNMDMDHPAIRWALAGMRWRRANDYLWDDLRQVRGEIDRLLDACEALGTKILVIDSLHKIWRRNLNDPEWVTEGLGVLKEQARLRGITTIALVHTSRDFKDKLRNNKYLPSYTSQQEKEADTIIGLKRVAKDNLLNLILVKRRAGKWNDEGSVCKVALSPTFGGYTELLEGWVMEDPKVNGNIMKSLMAHHKRLLCELPADRTFTFDDLDLGTKNRSAALRPLLARKVVEKVGGRGVRGNPYVFKVTDEGKLARKALQNEAGALY